MLRFYFNILLHCYKRKKKLICQFYFISGIIWIWNCNYIWCVTNFGWSFFSIYFMQFSNPCHIHVHCIVNKIPTQNVLKHIRRKCGRLLIYIIQTFKTLSFSTLKTLIYLSYLKWKSLYTCIDSVAFKCTD